MKKVINKKVYNTETAEVIADWDNNYPNNDFRAMRETLYKTKKGEYFLYGEGGPMTKWSRLYGDSIGSGNGIIRKSKEAAIDWLESHDFSETIVNEFPDEIEEA